MANELKKIMERADLEPDYSLTESYVEHGFNLPGLREALIKAANDEEFAKRLDSQLGKPLGVSMG